MVLTPYNRGKSGYLLGGKEQIVGQRGGSGLHSLGFDAERSQYFKQIAQALFGDREDENRYFFSLFSCRHVIIIDVLTAERQIALDLIFQHLLQIGFRGARQENFLHDGLILWHTNEK